MTSHRLSVQINNECAEVLRRVKAVRRAIALLDWAEQRRARAATAAAVDAARRKRTTNPPPEEAS